MRFHSKFELQTLPSPRTDVSAVCGCTAKYINLFYTQTVTPVFILVQKRKTIVIQRKI